MASTTVSRSRVELLALQRELELALEPPLLAPLVDALAKDVAEGETRQALLGHATALRTEGLSDWRRNAAVHAVASCCRRLQREGDFTLSAPVDDADFASFLRAAVHEDGKLGNGQSIALMAIQKRARCSAETLHVAAARALDEELAYVSDIDEQAYSIQIQHEDVEHALTELSRPRAKKDSTAASPVAPIDIGILTIREDEFRAVLTVFPAGKELRELRRHYNIRTADAGGGQEYRVAILRQLEQGNGEAQDAARDMIEELQPTLIIVVGIAGGVPHDDFTLGDVVVSTRINDYSVEARKEGAAPSYNLSGGAVAMQIAAGIANLPAREEELGDWASSLSGRPSVDVANAKIGGPSEWQEEVREKLALHFGGGAVRAPIVTAGILASSDKLVKDSTILIPWLQTARHTLAVEMESAGVYRAANGRALMLAIRAISDIVGLKRDAAWTKYACASAAAFTRAYLTTTPVTPKRGAPSDSSPEGLVRPGPSAGARDTRNGSGASTDWLPTETTLKDRSGDLVKPVSWQLCAEAGGFSGTKAQLYEALAASVVSYDMWNYKRAARWPRTLVLSEVVPKPHGSGVLRTFAYDTDAANVKGEEHLLQTADGSIVFQRDKLWADSGVVVDFGELALDVVLFLQFAANYVWRLGKSGEFRVRIRVRAPHSAEGTVAHFEAPILPEQAQRIARLHSESVEGVESLPTHDWASRFRLVETSKRLLDRIANEFVLGPSIFAQGGAHFLAISQDSVDRLASLLLGDPGSTQAPPHPASQNKSTSGMSAAALGYMNTLAGLYVGGGFPNHKVWTFDRGADDDVHNELRALGLIKLMGTKGAAWVLTDEGQRWIMENQP